MGIEPIANSLSPVESVGLTLLEDLIWAQKTGILRPGCAQIYPIAQNFARWETPKIVIMWAQLEVNFCAATLEFAWANFARGRAAAGFP